MRAFPIRWVVALPPEARPVIAEYHLRRDDEASRGGFPVFSSECGTVKLVQSGVGKVNAAAATAWLLAQEKKGDASVALWLNFGIAGSSSFGKGAICRADRVIDFPSGRSWYPQAVWKKKHDLPGGEVITVDAPTADYPDGGKVVEMEAAGFAPIALKAVGAELVQVVKVVSDGPDDSFEKVTPELATELCVSALRTMEPWLDAVSEIVVEEQQRLDVPTGFTEILERWHFTSTRTHQLKRLLQQWDSRNPGILILSSDVPRGCRNAEQFLEKLRAMLWPEQGIESSLK